MEASGWPLGASGRPLGAKVGFLSDFRLHFGSHFGAENHQTSSRISSRIPGTIFLIIFGLLKASGVDFDSILEPFLSQFGASVRLWGELWKERLAEPKKSENYE